MSQRNNNMLVHNLRAAVKMADVGMKPAVISAVFQAKDITMPAELVAGISGPGVLDSLGSKPITHDVVDQNIKGYVAFKESLAQSPFQDSDADVEAVECQDDGEDEE